MTVDVSRDDDLIWHRKEVGGMTTPQTLQETYDASTPATIVTVAGNPIVIETPSGGPALPALLIGDGTPFGDVAVLGGGSGVTGGAVVYAQNGASGVQGGAASLLSGAGGAGAPGGVSYILAGEGGAAVGVGNGGNGGGAYRSSGAGGDATAGNGGGGGVCTLHAGDAGDTETGTAGTAGSLALSSGDGGDAVGGAASPGGLLSIVAGRGGKNNTSGPAGIAADGGSIQIFAGLGGDDLSPLSGVAGNGGGVEIVGGTGGSSAQFAVQAGGRGGEVALVGGRGASGDVGGDGGEVEIAGGDGALANAGGDGGDGGDVEIVGGQGASDGDGGDIRIDSGTSTGAGARGEILIGQSGATNVSVEASALALTNIPTVGNAANAYIDPITKLLKIGTAGAGAVASVFGRTGAVVAAIGDYAFNQISGAIDAAQHAAQTDPTLHAIATTIANGFMSSADKTKLDGLPSSAVPTTRTLTAGAGMTGGGDLSADRTFTVGANADGSIVVNADDVQVGVLATDAQHGARGGGTQHAVATGSVAGFMSAADKTAFDALPVLAHGTYTPTLSNIANVASSTAFVCQYLRVGNSVTVSGKVTIDPTAATTLTQLNMSLPIASNFTAAEQCGGTGASASAAGLVLRIGAEATTDTARFQYISDGTAIGASDYFFSFTYLIA